MRGMSILTCLPLLFLAAGVSSADEPWRLHIPEEAHTAQRTSLVFENQFPATGKYELTGGIRIGEFDENDEISRARSADLFGVDLAGRYSPIDNLTLGLEVPLRAVDGPSGADGGGFGDIGLSLAILGYEHALEAPYVIPHVKVFLPTGDEDDGLGGGELRIRPGITSGFLIYNRWHMIGQLGYEFNDAIENSIIVSIGSIYEMNNRFGFTSELSVSDAEVGESKDQSVEAQVGFYYDWNNALRMNIRGGGGETVGEDAFGEISFTYNFGLE